MNQFRITSNSQQTEPPCLISMKLVESAFEYQREIMELKHEKSMKSKRLEILKRKNESLKKRKEETTQHIQDLESRLKVAKSRKETIQTRTKELKKLEAIMMHYGMNNKPIPHDIIQWCNSYTKKLSECDCGL
jgi:predicted  nucleic acid-binding Zn-ribbon protein